MIEPPTQHRVASILRGHRAPAVQAMQSSSEWSELVESATRDGLGGLVLESLRDHKEDVPNYAIRSLTVAAHSVAEQNNRLMAGLDPVLGALNAASIPVLLLKGAALNLCCYSLRSLRPMSDVDLLVREVHAARAVDVLSQMGCRSGAPLLRDDFFPRFYYETELISPDPHQVRIDLHARPLRPMRYARLIDERTFWNGATSVSVGNARAMVPAPETMFIHLAAHAAFHGCSRLIWSYDLCRWVRSHGASMDWDRMLSLCETWRLSLPVRHAIQHAEVRFGPIVPDAVREGLASHNARWKDRLTLRQAPHDAASPIKHVLTNLICAQGVRFRLAYLLAHLRPDPAHLAASYPHRHRGWTVIAAAYRVIRAGSRLITGIPRQLCLWGGLARRDSPVGSGPVTGCASGHNDVSIDSLAPMSPGI